MTFKKGFMITIAFSVHKIVRWRKISKSIIVQAYCFIRKIEIQSLLAVRSCIPTNRVSALGAEILSTGSSFNK